MYVSSQPDRLRRVSPVTSFRARAGVPVVYPVRGLGGLEGLGIVWFVPLIVSAAISAASQGAQSQVNKNRAKGAQKIGATNIVNDVERHMQRNLEAWEKSAKTVTDQATALQTYDNLWEYLTSTEGCGNAALGQAGQLCISERSPDGSWPYRSYYRDPIANDPGVVQDPPASAGVPASVAQGSRELLQTLGVSPQTSSSLADWVIPAALLVAGLWL